MHLLQAGSEEINDLRNGMERDRQRLVGPFPGQEGIFAGLAADMQELIAVQAMS
jgi:hypothetical protein